MSLSAGARLGPFEVVAPLGAGGMGEVYRARDLRLGREVAIKVLPEELSTDSDRLARFEQEARSASALNHPHIVTVYDVGRSDSVSWIAMELVDGKTLRELLTAGPLAAKRFLSIGAQAADALAKAHAAGIVHRDLKPENLMVSRDGFAKILDFGLAKLTAPSPSDSAALAQTALDATQPGTVLGTAGYMSPEQAAGGSLDFRSDQFSLGSILYEMAAGSRPFHRNTPAESMTAIMREEPEPLSRAAPSAPAPYRWIVERCLAKEPDDRYSSTLDLARELATLRDHLSEVSRTEEVVAEGRPASRGRGRLVPALLSVGLVCLALGAALAFLWKRETPAAVPEIRYLTHSGRDASPAASPDGRTIAFSSDRDGVRRIWLKQLLEGDEVSVTSGQDDFPRFSPDGSAILFSRTEQGRTSLFRIPSVGGEPRRLVNDVFSGDWSPDGRHVAFVRWRLIDGVTSSIVGTAAAADGAGAREIARVDNVTLIHPRWSPDSRMIALSETPLLGGGNPTAVYVVDADGSNTRTVSPPGAVGQVSSSAWVADDELVYSRSESVAGALTASAARVFRQNIRSPVARMILWSPINSVTLDLLGPGKLVFDGGSLRENLQQIPQQPGVAAPVERRWLTRGNSTDRQPVYSPDGEWVVFSSDRTINLDLWAVSTKSGAIRRLTRDTANDWDPGFMPDGRIMWSSNRSGPFEIWIAEADGSGARQLTKDGLSAQNPTATPDGKWIIYASGNPAHRGIWKIRPDGSGAVRLVSATVVIPEVSPDGQYVAYLTNRRTPMASVRVATVADGRDVPFSIAVGSQGRGGSFFTTGRTRWMPDGKAIAYIGQNESGHYGVYVQDFIPGRDTTGSRRPLAGFDADTATESFAFSRDGKWLTTAGWEQLSSVMIAEGVGGVTPARRR